MNTNGISQLGQSTEPGVWQHNWAILFPGDVYTGICPSMMEKSQIVIVKYDCEV
jgi:hypothetical protein